ncbi:protein of unknown function [Clostridium beijerinckii]|nr:protein of unknown function [Clostridium beijerinckii]
MITKLFYAILIFFLFIHNLYDLWFNKYKIKQNKIEDIREKGYHINEGNRSFRYSRAYYDRSIKFTYSRCSEAWEDSKKYRRWRRIRGNIFTTWFVC